MMGVYVVHHDHDPLLLYEQGVLREHLDMGHIIVWDFHGMLSQIPAAVLEAGFMLLDDYERRRRTFDKMPADVATVRWSQTLPLSSAESHDLDRDRTDI